MKNITYINAGAGSGKTYTLTHELARLICENNIHPEQVIMTTFTIKAANEFKAKAKACLHEVGRHDEAARLDQALIGTIHSVCQRMITKYWYYLGLSPDMDVMDENSKKFYISQSLAKLPKDEELEKLNDFVSYFGITHYNGNAYVPYTNLWRDQLSTIIDMTSSYEIEDYSLSRQESLRFIGQHVIKGKHLSDLDSILGAKLDGMIEEARQSVIASNRIKKKQSYFNKYDAISRKRNQHDLKWYKDVENELNASRCPSYAPVCEALKAFPIRLTEEIYNKQVEYINLLFDLAERWKKDFEKFKQENNLLDFNDMERYMLKLLRKKQPDVAKEIGESYCYLFVDEFQDCSPMQVKIFDLLSDQMKESYWVGDYKQSIYGFRGSDTELIKAVVDGIAHKEDVGKDGCHTRILPKSYRSLPDIVGVNNAIFEKAFGGLLDYDNIHLDADRKNEDGINSLRYFCIDGDADVAAHVAALIRRDKVKPNDIGILGRDRYDLDPVAKKLAECGVKVDRANLKVSEMMAWQLVRAILRIVANDTDNLAKAQVAALTEENFTTVELVDDKLLFDEDNEKKPKEFLSDVPLICSILKHRSTLQQQSVAAVVESLVIELRLSDVAVSLSDSASQASSFIQAILQAAKTYEDYCVQMTLPATIYGFIEYVEINEIKCGGDPEGVHVDTYHGSKGLEWPYVILLSLNKDSKSQTKTICDDIFGVHYVYTKKPLENDLTPTVFIRVAPYIYDGDKSEPTAKMLEQISQSAAYKDVVERNLRESKRLLYVGMTRPRDVLMLTKDEQSGKDSENKTFAWFLDAGIEIKNKQKTSLWDPFGTGYQFSDFSLTQVDAKTIKEQKDTTVPCKLKISRTKCDKLSPRYISPSGVEGTGTIVSKHEFGTRITLNGTPAMDEVGNCIHQIFAGIELGVDIQEVIKQYGLTATLSKPADIRMAWQQLYDHLTATYGTGCTFHERPFRMERDGQTVVGSIDLVWQTAKGDYLIDFKTYPGNKALEPNDKHFVGHYAGQLGIYKEALEAAGEKVLKCFIYYPVGGLLVEVGLEQ